MITTRNAIYVNKADVNFMFHELYFAPYIMYNNLIATKNRLTLKVPNIILISFIQVDNNFNDIITYTVNIKKLYEKNIDLLEKKLSYKSLLFYLPTNNRIKNYKYK